MLKVMKCHGQGGAQEWRHNKVRTLSFTMMKNMAFKLQAVNDQAVVCLDKKIVPERIRITCENLYGCPNHMDQSFGLDCSKLQALDNPGLVRNLISDVKAVE